MRAGARLEAIFALTFHMPDDAFHVLYKMYLDYTWPWAWMNNRICAHPAFTLGKKDQAARGPWVAVYTTSEATVRMAVDIEDFLWRERFPVASLNQTSMQRVHEARPTFERLAKSSLRACLWVNWIYDKVAAEAASVGGTSDAAPNLRNIFMKGFFDDEVDCMVASRSNGST